MAHIETSAFAPKYLEKVESWFKETQDILVFVRYSATAGNKEYFWFSEYTKFHEQLQRFPTQADVIVFRGNRFPLRDNVDETLIQKILSRIPDKTEIMFTNSVEPPNGNIDIYYCDSHNDIQESLSEFTGESIALGLEACWWENDNENMISALIPLEDGTLKRGIY